ncbi:MAG TPA: hypothetical protein VG204_18245 [Terriglobia bacterium]|nr:hypothetical protein [Terriglobia bacterium]
MKSIRKLKFLNQIALGVMTMCLFAGLGKAQAVYKGEFTLPFEAQWGSAVLPPGTYAFSISTASSPGLRYAVFLNGEGKNAIILPLTMPEQKVSSDDSHLTLVNTGGRYVVQSFQAAELGETFDYAVSKPKVKPMARRQVPVQDASGSATGK